MTKRTGRRAALVIGIWSLIGHWGLVIGHFAVSVALPPSGVECWPMTTPPLYAPWRIDYIKSLQKPDDGAACFLCAAAAADSDEQRRQTLTLWQTPHMVVMLNRYPYTNGHLLVAPKAHKGDLDQLTPDEQADLTKQTAEAVTLLRRAVGAQGFNVGINLGRVAGAGVPGHLHQHVVPRWAGDVNFMGVVGEVQVVPQAMSQLYEEMIRVRSS